LNLSNPDRMHVTSLLVVVLVPLMAQASQNWDGLRVTWDLNPFNTWAFDVLPRDLSKDDMHGFTYKDDQCAAGGSFKGKRYWYKDDPATITLYDVNGYIAGLQTSIPKSKYTPASQQIGHPLIDDGDFWTLTMYFVDPSTICTTGRSADQFASEGTGMNLWIQNGTDAVANSFQVPASQSDMGSTKWSKGHCFVTMGVHYWYNVRTDMSCDDFFPFFLLYNGGKLNGAGFALNVYLDSKRYEHPPTSVIGQFIDPLPTCFSTDPSYAKLSTQHVYMTDWPRTGCLC